ncbi:polyketide cyclase [Streptomyces griseorubiginosus]|uniref:Activator of Hsp90 ATPase-like protein n=1 Tax=Streptomyces griseorubiginosus TaxID=67304 RepID=A0AAI8PMM4_9ACTN|nr:polyketide cyclase [Streptomyces griseorubiginosus]AYC38404.1 hypothetical protein DWG14_02633 [Streptomyces griseorubiginosus]
MLSDTIERTVVINASVSRVWTELAEPAFLRPLVRQRRAVKVDLRPGGLLLSDHGVHGTIPVEPPHVFSWRWSQGTVGEEPTDTNATLVTFTLAEATTMGDTRLTMVENGFSRPGLTPDEATARHHPSSSTEGAGVRSAGSCRRGISQERNQSTRPAGTDYVRTCPDGGGPR